MVSFVVAHVDGPAVVDAESGGVRSGVEECVVLEGTGGAVVSAELGEVTGDLGSVVGIAARLVPVPPQAPANRVQTNPRQATTCLL